MTEEPAQAAVSEDEIEPPPPEPTEASTGRKWFEVVFVTGMTILPFFWFGLQAFLRHLEPDPYATFRDWPAMGHFINSMLAIVPAGMLVLASPEGFAHFGLRRPRWNVDLGLGIIGMLACLAASWGLHALYAKCGLAWGMARRDPWITEGADITIYVAVMIFSCFGQELACRGLLQTRLTELLGAPAGIALSVALFGSFHIYQGWAGMAACTLFGLVLAVFFRFSRSLWPCVVAHTIWNVTIAFR